MVGEKKRTIWNQAVRFNIDTVKNVIISKESRGADASHERGLLESWKKYEGYEYAAEALQECGSPATK